MMLAAALLLLAVTATQAQPATGAQSALPGGPSNQGALSRTLDATGAETPFGPNLDPNFLKVQDMPFWVVIPTGMVTTSNTPAMLGLALRGVTPFGPNFDPNFLGAAGGHDTPRGGLAPRWTGRERAAIP
jgi:hypothetical protein